MSEPRGRSAHVDDFTRRMLPPRELWGRIDYDSLPELKRYPGQINCATELLDKQAARFGNKVAFKSPTVSWSYAELLARTNRIAHVLVEDLGIKPGNRVLLRSFNNPMYVAAWLAVMKVGAVAVATMPMLRARELAFIADRAEIGVALCDIRLKDELAQAMLGTKTLKRAVYWGEGPDSLDSMAEGKPATFQNVDTAADDPCMIAFTSGTTGQPKGAIQFHRDIMAICDTYSRYVLKPGPDDVFAGSPPIAFAFGLGALLAFPLHAGATTLLVEQFNPQSMLQAIQDHRISVLFTAPTAYRAMIDLAPKFDLSSLKKCVSAGETLPAPTFKAWEAATGLQIMDGIGSTEMLHIFLGSPEGDLRAGTTGKPVPGYEAVVLDEAGNPAPTGTVGRLAVRGPTACRYLDNVERQRGYVHDGWNLTGDAYLVDSDGHFHYQARTDDMIISAGYNIAGPEVETVLLEHPKVLEAAVIGAPDAERGMIVKAFVVLRDRTQANDATVKELQDHVKATIAPYKYPRAVVFRDQLPKTGTGKLQRFVLRDEEKGSAS
jgi:2-aminobenzoate-CoA ligase